MLVATLNRDIGQLMSSAGFVVTPKFTNVTVASSSVSVLPPIRTGSWAKAPVMISRLLPHNWD